MYDVYSLKGNKLAVSIKLILKSTKEKNNKLIYIKIDWC